MVRRGMASVDSIAHRAVCANDGICILPLMGGFCSTKPMYLTLIEALSNLLISLSPGLQ